MAAETSEIRRKTRRVKDHILTRYLKFVDMLEDGQVLSDYERGLYTELTMKFAANVMPRTQEVTGEDGEAIKLVFDSAFQNGTSRQTETDSAEPGEVQDN